MQSNLQIEQARAAFNVHRDDVALQKALDALAADHDNIDAHGLLFDIFSRTEDLAAARRHAQEIIRISPSSSLGYRCLAWAWLSDDVNGEDGRTALELALENGQQAMAFGPDEAHNFWLAAQVELRRGLPTCAVELCNQGLVLEADNVELFFTRAQAYRACGFGDAALWDTEQALALLPESAALHQFKSRLHAERGELSAYREHASQTLSLHPTQTGADAIHDNTRKSTSWLQRVLYGVNRLDMIHRTAQPDVPSQPMAWLSLGFVVCLCFGLYWIGMLTVDLAAWFWMDLAGVDPGIQANVRGGVYPAGMFAALAFFWIFIHAPRKAVQGFNWTIKRAGLLLHFLVGAIALSAVAASSGELPPVAFVWFWACVSLVTVLLMLMCCTNWSSTRSVGLAGSLIVIGAIGGTGLQFLLDVPGLMTCLAAAFPLAALAAAAIAFRKSSVTNSR